jgi:hypothetical protein
MCTVLIGLDWRRRRTLILHRSEVPCRQRSNVKAALADAEIYRNRDLANDYAGRISVIHGQLDHPGHSQPGGWQGKFQHVNPELWRAQHLGDLQRYSQHRGERVINPGANCELKSQMGNDRQLGIWP